MLQMQSAPGWVRRLEASLLEIDGRYWLVVDRFEQPEESNWVVERR